MRQSILVVDDIVENVKVLEALLSVEYDVKVATSGKVALKIIEKIKPDLILLDIVMPEMDGFELCEKLKSDPTTKHIPIIFVTGQTSDEDITKAFKLGGVDYISKPINPVVLEARVRTHLLLSDQKTELYNKVKEKTRELSNRSIEFIERLGIAAEYKDNESGMHIKRISRFSYILARGYGLSKEEAEIIESAAPMHDVGKIGIKESVLYKPGRLSEEEWAHMMKHSEIGHRILGDQKDKVLSYASCIALQHHEKWNGFGYPNRLKGEEISLYARIVAVADVFDALTSKRPYNEPWSIVRAIELIKSESGHHFDPKVVKAFLDNIDKIIAVKEKYKD